MSSKTRSPAPSAVTANVRAASVRPYRPSITSPRRKYDADASIALLGIRGTGLSTLAVMAASALGFRLIDADQHFFLATRLSRAEYRATHGDVKYRSEEMSLMRSMLSNASRHVIVCGPGAVEATGQDLLAHFAQSHPVIYVTRNATDIQQHLGVYDAERISTLLLQCAPIFRSLSAFEFHNLSDLAGRDMGETHASHQSSPRSLALKRVEHDFLYLLRFITEKKGGATGPDLQHLTQPAPLRTRPYTYALSLPISVSEAFLSEISEVDVISDAVELNLAWSAVSSETPPALSISTADYITRQYYAVRRNVRLPVIFNLQLAQSDDLPVTRKEMECYFEVLHHGLRLGVEFLTVNLAFDDDLIRDLVAAKGATSVIAQQSCFPGEEQPSWDDPDWPRAIRRAESLDADMVRLCRPAASHADNIAVRHFLDQVSDNGEFGIPVMAYNTGHAGRMSRYLNPTLSPVTCDLARAHLLEDQDSHLLTAKEAQVALYASLMLDSMYFGIYGRSVALSLSPDMHNQAFRYGGMPHEYRVFQHDSLDDLRRLIRDPCFGGMSITAPFKSEVVTLVDSLSPEAQAIGAVNTVIPLRSAGGGGPHPGPAAAVYGENTDWRGIDTCVRQNLSPINAVKRRTTALVVGAGGMARAATYALIRMGVRQIAVHNRTKERAQALARQFQESSIFGDGDAGRSSREGSVETGRTAPGIRIVAEKSDPWPEDMAYPTIVISCVPTKNVDGQACPDTSLPAAWLASPTGGVVIELSYTPLETHLLKQVRAMDERGWIAVDGLQVLPEQGKMQFELFTNRRAPIRVMRKAVVEGYRRRGMV